MTIIQSEKKPVEILKMHSFLFYINKYVYNLAANSSIYFAHADGGPPIIFHKQFSGTMARRPAHVEQPARHSPANRPRERSESRFSKLSLSFTPCIISESIE